MCTDSGRRVRSWGHHRNPGENLLTTKNVLDLGKRPAHTHLCPEGAPPSQHRDGVEGFGRRSILGDGGVATERQGTAWVPAKAPRGRAGSGASTGSQLLAGPRARLVRCEPDRPTTKVVRRGDPVTSCVGNGKQSSRTTRRAPRSEALGRPLGLKGVVYRCPTDGLAPSSGPASAGVATRGACRFRPRSRA